MLPHSELSSCYFLPCFLLLLRLVAAVDFTLETNEVSAIFIFTTKTTQPHSHGALTCKDAAFLKSFPRQSQNCSKFGHQ